MNHGDRIYDDRADQMINSSNKNGDESNAESNHYII
jgi:hypothetical protein